MPKDQSLIKRITRLSRFSFLISTTQISSKNEENSLKNQIKKHIEGQLKSKAPLFSLALHQDSHETLHSFDQWPNSILSNFDLSDFDLVFLFLTPRADNIPTNKLLSTYKIKNKSIIAVFIKQESLTTSLAA
jgi:hypothetical protein